MDIRLRKAIMNRGTVPDSYLNVERLLKLHDMEGYRNICANRIIDRMAEFDSMDDVAIDFEHDNGLCLNLDGVLFCRDILSGYVGMQAVKQYISYLRSENKIVDCLNDQANLLRACDTSILRDTLKKSDALFVGEADISVEDFRQMIQLEIKARNPLHLTYIGLKKKVTGIWSRLWLKSKFGLI